MNWLTHGATLEQETVQFAPTANLPTKNQKKQFSMVDIRKVGHACVWVTEGPYTRTFAVSELAERLEVSVSTVYRWCRCKQLPVMVACTLRCQILGILPHKRWSGWHFDLDGRLWASNGHGFMPAELDGWALVFQTNEALWREIRELRAIRDSGVVLASQGAKIAK